MRIQAFGNKIPRMSNYAKSAVAALMLATSPLLLQAKDTDSFQKEETTISQQDKKETSDANCVWIDIARYLCSICYLAYIGIISSKFIKKPNIDEVARNFSEIYRKDISVEDAEKMCQRYKKIFDIKNENEFRQTLFEQVKKDYGLGGTKWDLEVVKLGLFTGGAFCSVKPFLDKKSEKGCVYVNSVTNKQRVNFFITIIHELNHVKQYQISYMTNSDATIDALGIKKTIYNYILNKYKITDKKENINRLLNRGMTNEEISQIILKKTGINVPEIMQNAKEKFIEGLGTTKPNSLSKGSKEYNLGLKYIENNKHYTNKVLKGYYNQFTEEESFYVENLMNQSCNYFLEPRQRFRISLLNIF